MKEEAVRNLVLALVAADETIEDDKVFREFARKLIAALDDASKPSRPGMAAGPGTGIRYGTPF